MGKFNWWRRYKKVGKLQSKDAFKGKSFLLQQIEHGDFDYSDYKRQAEEELERCKVEQQKLASTWIAGPESLQERLDEITRKYTKRYNKLMEDHDAEEFRLLHELRERLFKEEKIDVWDEAIEQGVDSLTKFYYIYKDIAKNKKLQHGKINK
jgi:hypothetical protein